MQMLYGLWRRLPLVTIDRGCYAGAQVRELHGSDASTVGNQAAVRTWTGDVESVPAFQGPFDAAFFNAVFGNVYDQHEALLRTCLLLRPGACPASHRGRYPEPCRRLHRFPPHRQEHPPLQSRACPPHPYAA
jgi:hypothetical protein